MILLLSNCFDIPFCLVVCAARNGSVTATCLCAPQPLTVSFAFSVQSFLFRSRHDWIFHQLFHNQSLEVPFVISVIRSHQVYFQWWLVHARSSKINWIFHQLGHDQSLELPFVISVVRSHWDWYQGLFQGWFVSIWYKAPISVGSQHNKMLLVVAALYWLVRKSKPPFHLVKPSAISRFWV